MILGKLWILFEPECGNVSFQEQKQYHFETEGRKDFSLYSYLPSYNK